MVGVLQASGGALAGGPGGSRCCNVSILQWILHIVNSLFLPIGMRPALALERAGVARAADSI
jgi:hypothetical protein